MLKRITALVLVLVLLLSMLASCGGDENDGQKETAGGNNISQNPETAKIDEYLQELNSQYSSKVSGKTFTWVGVGVTKNEEEVGDLQEDSHYYRQRDLEEIFGINWVTAVAESVNGGHATFEAVKQDVLAGNKTYNAAGGTTAAVCQPLFVQGCLADVSDYIGIDLDREWWTASLRDTYQICGATYFLTGPITSSYYVDSYGIMFNKEVAENYDIPDLYELVENNEWTFDKFFEVSELVPSNENGSGAYRFNKIDGPAAMYASGMTIMHFDETGSPYVPDSISPELSDLADRFSGIFGDTSITVYAAHDDDYEKIYGGHEEDLFIDGKMLFYIACMGDAAGMREEDVDFGIVPLPKGSVNQENYVSYINPWGAFHVVVPKSTSDEDVTGVILEAMAALGVKYLKPALYENILKGRSTYDRASKDMIDIIFASKTYDLINMLPEDESFVKMLDYAITVSSDNFASRYLLQARIVNATINMRLNEIMKDTK